MPAYIHANLRIPDGSGRGVLRKRRSEPDDPRLRGPAELSRLVCMAGIPVGFRHDVKRGSAFPELA